MGLLDQILGNAIPRAGHPQPKPGLGSTVAAGIALALLVKAVRQYQATHPQGGAQRPADRAISGPGGLGGILGGLPGSGRLGGLLGRLGGAGALGALVSHLQDKGLGREVGSWISPDQNEPIAPQKLADALGPETVRALQQQTGMPKDALLAELSQELPEAINQVTPKGELPADVDLHEIVRSSSPPA
jgi:uncharacterized protein YidB (DUF937 family)